jgi:probable F420-dependent oxidoreductase
MIDADRRRKDTPMASLKLDTGLQTSSYKDIPEAAREAEALGFAGLWTAETQHDPFLPLAVAATATERIQLGTAIAVAFPRAPMAVAETAWDLAANSGGRFILGLGTQVKGHNERRFSVPWTPPGPRLRDYLRCLRAIFTYWQNGSRGQPNFTSEHYQFRLSSPFFSPEPLPAPYVDGHGEMRGVPIYIAAVNDYLVRLAGELCDGIHIHPFHSARYLTDIVMPNLEKGAAKTGRTVADVERATTAFVIMGDTEEERARAREGVRQQISFYASTRTYHEVLAVHGWGDVSAQLNEMSNKGQWGEMRRLITDEMLDVYAVEGTAEEIPSLLHQKYDGLLTRASFYMPYQGAGDTGVWQRVLRAFNANLAEPSR